MYSIITFNLEYGAEKYGIDRAANLIASSHSTIALLQETRQHEFRSPDVTVAIASRLGWYFLRFENSSTAILSTLPITKIGEGICFGLAKIGELFVCVIHLLDYPYIAFEAVGIKYPAECTTDCFRSTDAVQLRNRSFAKHFSEYAELREAFGRLPKNAKIIAGGDFNEPSHLDWTAKAVLLGRVPFTIKFPNSTVMENLGFIDAYRTIFPDPISNPGYTWPDHDPGYPFRSDRIDYIFAKNLTVKSAEVIPTFVSDHSIVRVTLSVVG